MPQARLLIQTFNEYGSRTTVNGLSHVYQSNTMYGRLFWIFLTLVSATACSYHIHKTVDQYLDTQVTSILLDKEEKTIFPDVTICNLKPISESLLYIGKQQILDHIETNFKFFDNWFPKERHRQANESRQNYKSRLKNIFKKYMSIMWVSDDTRDIGMMDKIMLLSCIYKNQKCNGKDFKLIQHHEHWNCYNFIPSDRSVETSDHTSGLELILYTDSNFAKDPYYSHTAYRRNKTRDDEMHNPYNFREYVTTGNRSFNQILEGNTFKADGLKVIVHKNGEFPTLGNIKYVIEHGMTTTIEFEMTKTSYVNRPPKHECRNEDLGKMQYVTSFGKNGSDIRRRTYHFSQEEAIVNLKQEFIFNKCRCYTHKLPFNCSTTQLCYYAKTSHQIIPSHITLDRINCHDNAFKTAESKALEYMEKTKHYIPCNDVTYTASKVQTYWPRADDWMEFVNHIILPSFTNGTEFKGDKDKHKHHFLKNLMVNNKSVSREDVILQSLLNHCTKTNSTEPPLLDNVWCLQPVLLLQNVVRIWIKPNSPAAKLYREMYSYDWPEALSELGGLFGLWIGMSLLTFFELIELIFLMVTAHDHDRSTRNARSDIQHQYNHAPSSYYCPTDLGIDKATYETIEFADQTL